MAEQTLAEIQADIEEHYGFFPPFFEPALYESLAMLQRLWSQTVTNWISNPLPVLFKEKLMARLSRYCSVPYCVVCHSCALRALGVPSREILEMLEEPGPHSEQDMEDTLNWMSSLTSGMNIWPERNSAIDRSLLRCSEFVFLKPGRIERCRTTVERLVGRTNCEHWMALISYIEMCHNWTETHPDISYEGDRRFLQSAELLFHEEPRLAEFFRKYGEVVKGQRMKLEPRAVAQAAARASADEALRETDNLLNAIIKGTADAIYVKDLEGKYLMINPAGARIYGKTVEDVLGKDDTVLFPPELAQKIIERDRSIIVSGETQVYEQEVIINGVTRTNLTTKSPYRDGQGRTIGIIGISHDISERKRAEKIREVFTSLGQKLGAATTPKEAAMAVLTASDSFFGWDACFVFIYVEREDRFYPVVAIDTVEGERKEILLADDFEVSPLVRKTLKEGPQLLNRAADSTAGSQLVYPFGNKNRLSASCMFVAIKRGVQNVGLLSIQSYSHNKYSRSDLEPLQVLANYCSGTLERTVAEAKLRKSELALKRINRQYELILGATPEGIYGVDLEGNITFANPSIARLIGVQPEELSGKPQHTTLQHRKADGTVYPYESCPVCNAVKDGKVRLLDDEVFWKKDGTSVPVDYVSTPIREHGKMVGAVVTMRDTTERKRAEEALKRSEVRFKMLARATNDALWDWNLATDEMWWNENVQTLFGYPVHEASTTSKWWLDHVHPEDRQRVESGIHAVTSAGEEFWAGEYRFQCGDGSYAYVFDRGYVIYGANRQAVYIISSMMDISDRKRAEERQKELAAELARSNRELQDFTSVASHDLKEPLNKVQMFSERLRKELGEENFNDKAKDYMERINGAIKRMHTLIDDLLTLSRVTTKAQPFVPVDLAQVSREVVSDLEARIERTKGNVQLGDLPTVDADPLQMRQLMQNLIGNGLKYFRPDVPPVVKVFAKTIKERRAAATSADEELVQIFVMDNGIGFDEKYVDRIFAPFQRLVGRNEYEGTGVGLAICRKICERHGGSITAKSTPGQGSTFIATLPLKQHTTQTQTNA